MDNLIIYKDQNNNVQVDVSYENDSLWLSLNQISELFGRDKSVVSRHIRNIYKDNELDEFSTVAKKTTVQNEGIREVTREIEFYNLNLIISVGYRVSSAKATQFRIWATNILNEYLVYGYSLNEKRLEQTQQEIKILKSGINIIFRTLKEKEKDYEWLKLYSSGLALLDDYDHESLDAIGHNQQSAIFPSRIEYQELINEMKVEFESEVFGIEKDGSFESAINQITKGYDDYDFYPSLEEKAAMLLYLIVKNHAFVDGNKRIAATCFLLFLKKNNLLENVRGESIINSETLASTTLFIAESKPEEMETVRKLVISILNRNQ